MMESKTIILFDGVCNLCNASINFVIDRDVADIFRFGTLQSEEGQRLITRHNISDPDLTSIVLIEPTESSRWVVYRESDAILRIASRLPGIWKLSPVLRVFPAWLRDTVYRWVSKNRYRWFGRMDSCRVPGPELLRKFIEPIR